MGSEAPERIGIKIDDGKFSYTLNVDRSDIFAYTRSDIAEAEKKEATAEWRGKWQHIYNRFCRNNGEFNALIAENEQLEIDKSILQAKLEEAGASNERRSIEKNMDYRTPA